MILDSLRAIEKKVEAHPIVNHPFLLKLKSGGYSKSQIKLFIRQQFYFSSQFPRCLGLLWSKIPNFVISLPLMKFLAIEHWGSVQQGAHWQLFEKVLTFFELTIEELRSQDALPETRQYLDFRFDLCLKNSVEEGLGCMGFAHELVNESIFHSYYKGVSLIPDVPDHALEYFKSHVDDEPEDYQIFKNIINAYVESNEGLQLVEKGALETLTQRSLYFSKIQDRLDNFT